MERWGFAVLVAIATVTSVGVAATVAMPYEVPSFALQAAPVYRLETGVATFIGLYLLALALVLALHNRGFTDIGVRGIRAQGLTGKAEQRGFAKHESTILQMERAIERLEQGEAD